SASTSGRDSPGIYCKPSGRCAWQRVVCQLLGRRLDDCRARGAASGRSASPPRCAGCVVRSLFGRDRNRLAATRRTLRHPVLPLLGAASLWGAGGGEATGGGAGGVGDVDLALGRLVGA